MSFTSASAPLPACDTPMATSMLQQCQTLPFRNSILKNAASMRAQKLKMKCSSGPLAYKMTELSDGRQVISFTSRTNSSRDSFRLVQESYFNARKLYQKNRRACSNKTARTTTYNGTSGQAASEKFTDNATTRSDFCARRGNNSKAGVGETGRDDDDQSDGKLSRILSPLSNIQGAIRMGTPIEPQDCNGLRSAHSSKTSNVSHQSHNTSSSQSADREIDPAALTKASPDMPRNELPAEAVQQTLSNDFNSRYSDKTDSKARSSNNNRILHASRGRLLHRRAALVGAAGATACTDVLQRCCGWCAQAVRQAMAAAPPATAPETASEWTYGDNACLASSWGGLCSSGRRQSPIDITVRPPKRATTSWSGSVVSDGGSGSSRSSALAASPPLGLGSVLNFEYSAGAPSVLNTGHRTVQVSFKSSKNTLKVGDKSFQLQQFHFHAPSEHAVNGERYAMEAHLVHQDPQTGKLAVVGVKLDASKSALPNECLAASLAYVPREHGQSVDPPIQLSPSLLLPPALESFQSMQKSSRSYVHYSGSLTTPPCSEDVDWFILDTPVRIATSEVLDFMFFAGDGHSMAFNARPLQSAGDRQITRGP